MLPEPEFVDLDPNYTVRTSLLILVDVSRQITFFPGAKRRVKFRNIMLGVGEGGDG